MENVGFSYEAIINKADLDKVARRDSEQPYGWAPTDGGDDLQGDLIEWWLENEGDWGIDVGESDCDWVKLSVWGERSDDFFRNNYVAHALSRFEHAYLVESFAWYDSAVRIEDYSESPFCDLDGSPLDPFFGTVIYEIAEVFQCDDETGWEDYYLTLDEARNVYTANKVVNIMGGSGRPLEMSDCVIMDRLDENYEPGKAVDLHDEFLRLAKQDQTISG